MHNDRLAAKYAIRSLNIYTGQMAQALLETDDPNLDLLAKELEVPEEEVARVAGELLAGYNTLVAFLFGELKAAGVEHAEAQVNLRNRLDQLLAGGDDT